MLLMNPLDCALRIEQNRSEIRRVLRFETGVNEVSRISPQHFGRMLGNQAQQALASPAIGTID